MDDNVVTKLEAAFEQEMETTYHEAAKLGYRATYFMRMVREHGGMETARRLLAQESSPEGLGRLWELGRLDISVEAIVLKPEYTPLFTDEERRIARERLAEMSYKAPWDRRSSE